MPFGAVELQGWGPVLKEQQTRAAHRIERALGEGLIGFSMRSASEC